MARRTQFRLLIAVTLAWIVWAGWSLLDDPGPFTVRVLDDVGDPVVNAVVAAEGRQLGLTGANGRVEVDPTGGLVEISAPGHLSATFTVTPPDDGVFDAVLKARVLRGRVLDPEGRPVPRARVSAGDGEGWTDEDGQFTVRGAESGVVTVHRPAWEEAEFEWSGGPGEQEVVIEPLILKAVHITGDAVDERLSDFVEMAATTELNALMVDLKNESGQVLYDSSLPDAEEVGALANMYDLAEVVEAARAEDLYLIGRLVTFQDPVAARAAPEMSVLDETTGQPFTSQGQYFLDPTDADARAYALGLAEEVCAAGVDEVQFDYVRFPDARPESVTFDGGVTADVRRETIRGFLREALNLLNPMGCAVAVDVFGFVTTASDDGGIGQRWEDIISVTDVVSPMIYPSHYDPGWYGLDSPNDDPARVVDQALVDAMSRRSGMVVVRPWLQDFGYDAELVREQVEMAESHGLGWMLWNATSNVTTGALEPG